MTLAIVLLAAGIVAARMFSQSILGALIGVAIALIGLAMLVDAAWSL